MSIPSLLASGRDGLSEDTDTSAAAMSAIGKPTTHGSNSISATGGGDKIQSLKVWEPPSFCMAFFWYVPLDVPSRLHFSVSVFTLQSLFAQLPLLSFSTDPCGRP
jgi:hypothetical protein